MHFNSGRLFIFTAFAAGLGLTALQASAQEARFHLPFEARWGSAVLEPGNYSLSVPVGQAQPIVRLSGEGRSSLVAPMLTGIEPVSDHSSLQLVKVNGAYFVKEYNSGATGRVFTFGVPKPEVESTIASSRATAIAVEEGIK